MLPYIGSHSIEEALRAWSASLSTGDSRYTLTDVRIVFQRNAAFRGQCHAGHYGAVGDAWAVKGQPAVPGQMRLDQ